jgi:hypothetical protein
MALQGKRAQTQNKEEQGRTRKNKEEQGRTRNKTGMERERDGNGTGAERNAQKRKELLSHVEPPKSLKSFSPWNKSKRKWLEWRLDFLDFHGLVFLDTTDFK